MPHAVQPYRRKQDQKARAVNRNFGKTPEQINAEQKAIDDAHYGIKRYRKWTIRRFLEGIDGIVNEEGHRLPPTMIDACGEGATSVFMSLYRVAIRDNSDLPYIFCPKCKQKHKVEITHACPSHPEACPDLPVLTESVALEKNSLQAAMKLFDKIIPTLASVDHTVNIQGQISTVSIQLTQLLFKYVPVEKRSDAMNEIRELLNAVREPQD